MSKYIFVTGGVVSGLGKGITAASLGRLLKARGYKISVLKLDPYLNFDPGSMNPCQHGEVFVTDDGAETDLDLGHYERFIDENATKYSNLTSGKVYWSVINKDRKGMYKGATVQVIPHITNEIKERIALSGSGADIVIVEIGGTVGDIESQPFVEAIRQYSTDIGRDNCVYLHVTLVPYLMSSKEHKTKPTQHSVKTLLSFGIQPDIIVCRTEYPIDEANKEKIALFCNIPKNRVIQNLDIPILYEIPIELENEGLAKVVMKRLNLREVEADLSEWKTMVNKFANPDKKVRIALVGEYIALQDSYISVAEALKHAAAANNAELSMEWIEASCITDSNAAEKLGGADGIIVPGNFGACGLKGFLETSCFARLNNKPYFGICSGMHAALIDVIRSVGGIKDANTIEIDPNTNHPLIAVVEGDTPRLGSFGCKISGDSYAWLAYGTKTVSERHRNRFEINNLYRDELVKSGVSITGVSSDNTQVEIIEIKNGSWFLGCSFNPEYKSRPNRPHPLFNAFIKSAIENRQVR